MLDNKPRFALLSAPIPGEVVLTLENYEKWYSIWLIEADGSVSSVPPEDIRLVSGDDLLWIDHCFHPELLLRLAKHYNASVSPVVLEVATGRWVMEGNPQTTHFSYFLEDDDE